MDPLTFAKSAPGKLIEASNPSIGSYTAFVPNALPPELVYSATLVNKHGDARAALRGLSELGNFLPNPDLLIMPYLRREAELSSRIEGTRATLEDLYLFEVDAPTEAPPSDVREVLNYVKALYLGLDSQLPISQRLVRLVHEQLMQGVRGDEKRPGEYRRIQNFIAPEGIPLKNATYVPPSPDLLPDLLNQWENFFHAREDIPILVRVALAHYQFEAIHPFGGGNGRVGRLLVILMLHKCGVLSLPLLYLSAFFEQNRQAYYDLLRGITEQGRWTDWIEFFLEAIISQAEDAIARSQRVIELRKKYKVQLESNYRSISYPRLLDFVFQKPIFTSPEASKFLGVTVQNIANILKEFEKLGIIKETTGHYHHRIYRVPELMNLLKE